MSDFQLKCTTWMNEKQVADAVQKASVTRVAKCAALVEAEAKRLLSKGTKESAPPGRDPSRKRVRFIASPPGEPPFIRTGNLRASIAFAKTGQDTYVVGPATTAWYGRIHEFGGVYSGKRGPMHFPARPFMRPALNHTVDKFPALFANLPLGGTVSK